MKVETEISKKELKQNKVKYCWLDKTRICDDDCIAYCSLPYEKCLILYILVEINNSIMKLKRFREE
jgi:hypothetical protein